MAHPKKNTNTGEIVDVEPDEARYLLEVILGVVVYHFIEAPRQAARGVAILEKIVNEKDNDKMSGNSLCRSFGD